MAYRRQRRQRQYEYEKFRKGYRSTNADRNRRLDQREADLNVRYNPSDENYFTAEYATDPNFGAQYGGQLEYRTQFENSIRAADQYKNSGGGVIIGI